MVRVLCSINVVMQYRTHSHLIEIFEALRLNPLAFGCLPRFGRQWLGFNQYDTINAETVDKGNTLLPPCSLSSWPERLPGHHRLR